MKQKFFDAVNTFFEHNKFSGLMIGLLAFIIILPFSFTDAYESFELKLFDVRFQIKPSIDEWDRLCFVDIDENSTTALGQFPWTRDIYADGLKVLNELGAHPIALDIMFPDDSPVRLNDQAYEDLISSVRKKSEITEEQISSVIKDNDKIFAHSIKKSGNTILSYTFSSDVPQFEVLERQKSPEFINAKNKFNKIASLKIPEDRLDKFSDLIDPDIKAIVYPIPGLMDKARSFGFVNRFTDVDGTIRRVRLIRVFDGRLYFNLALSMLIDAAGVTKENIVVNPGENIILKQAFNSNTQRFENIEIPIDNHGMMYVNWAGPGPREKSFQILPFYSLLEYGQFADAVYDFFDTAGGSEGIQKRAELYHKIETLSTAYPKVKDDAERLKVWNEIKTVKSDLKKIKLSYLTKLKKEHKRLTDEFSSSPSDSLKKDINAINEDIKAVDLIIRTEELSGKMTITGLTATGTHDIASIPIHNEYPAVGTYFNTINTIINREYIIKPGVIFTYLLIMIISLATGFIMQRLPARKSLFTGIGLFFLFNGLVFILFGTANLWIHQLGTNLALLIPSVSIISIKLVSEESQKRFIKGAFSRYIAPDVIDEILEHPESLELGGENRHITIFFSDVAGFSSLSEKLTPPELVARLNEYLSEMTDIIISHGGTVDKYEGDAIMAFYGAPQTYPDHELRACMAAIDMKAKLREMQEHWRDIGQQELFVRMGMNTGEAVVGNMGSKMRMDYTAMGDSVNLASRLEGANKFYSTTAMISGFTYSAVKDHIDSRKLDIIRVVGKTEPIEIYELMGKKGTLPDKVYDCIEKYNIGLDYFNVRQWKKAQKSFNDALKILPDDGPSLTYVKRCEEFMKKPPSKKWDGVYSMKSK